MPRPRPTWAGYVIVALLMTMLMSWMMISGSTGSGRDVARLLSAGAMIGVVAGAAVMAVSAARRLRAERAMIEAAGELVQLRRWPQAGLVLEQILSRPAPSHGLRGQALVYLASVLARYHRFDDAIAVQNHLLEHELVDPATAFGLRVGRAMAMLREDHLLDADRAISELRRLEGTGESAALALVEIYRDVKTGHPDEAIDLFQTRLPTLRDQLGHRAGRRVRPRRPRLRPARPRRGSRRRVGEGDAARAAGGVAAEVSGSDGGRGQAPGAPGAGRGAGMKSEIRDSKSESGI